MWKQNTKNIRTITIEYNYAETDTTYNFEAMCLDMCQYNSTFPSNFLFVDVYYLNCKMKKRL